MEAKGRVNVYVSYKPRLPVRTIFTLNLACGVTPFMIFEGGIEYSSNIYNLRDVAAVTVTHVWYRPAREEFDELDPETQTHVLNGGLLRAPLGKQTLASDPTVVGIDFQAFCLRQYGRRIG